MEEWSKRQSGQSKALAKQEQVGRGRRWWMTHREALGLPRKISRAKGAAGTSRQVLVRAVWREGWAEFSSTAKRGRARKKLAAMAGVARADEPFAVHRVISQPWALFRPWQVQLVWVKRCQSLQVGWGITQPSSVWAVPAPSALTMTNTLTKLPKPNSPNAIMSFYEDYQK